MLDGAYSNHGKLWILLAFVSAARLPLATHHTVRTLLRSWCTMISKRTVENVFIGIAIVVLALNATVKLVARSAVWRAQQRAHENALWSVDRKEVALEIDSWTRYRLDSAQEWAPLFPQGGVIHLGPDHTLLPPGKYITMFQYLEYPASRGKIHIKSQNPYVEPFFDSGFMNNKADFAPIRWSYKKTREVARRMDAFRGELASHHPHFHPASPAACRDIDIKTAGWWAFSAGCRRLGGGRWPPPSRLMLQVHPHDNQKCVLTGQNAHTDGERAQLPFGAMCPPDMGEIRDLIWRACRVRDVRGDDVHDPADDAQIGVVVLGREVSVFRHRELVLVLDGAVDGNSERRLLCPREIRRGALVRRVADEADVRPEQGVFERDGAPPLADVRDEDVERQSAFLVLLFLLRRLRVMACAASEDMLERALEPLYGSAPTNLHLSKVVWASCILGSFAPSVPIARATFGLGLLLYVLPHSSYWFAVFTGRMGDPIWGPIATHLGVLMPILSLGVAIVKALQVSAPTDAALGWNSTLLILCASQADVPYPEGRP
ncbi:hypothetical protein NUW54_g9685 [Trametes sanguinea]|uniref:Uncharacterized protein n=1 Tax=Trametes sanguinea TaxID=158606 RepID=A0ACC1P5B9_9APHY|nr:hypothetical protein NUW54_g9685 [Trametes sanguinea]